MYFKRFYTCEPGRSIIVGLPKRFLSVALPELFRIFFYDHIRFHIEEADSLLKETLCYFRNIGLRLGSNLCLCRGYFGYSWRQNSRLLCLEISLLFLGAIGCLRWLIVGCSYGLVRGKLKVLEF
jgi:hypothetical protein